MVYFGSYSSDTHDPLSGDRRAVFLLEKGVAVVVKFIRGVGYSSVKVWDTSRTSLERTIAAWKTSNRYDASVGEIMSAYSFAKEQLGRANATFELSDHSV